MQETWNLACGTVRSNRVDLPREICGLQEKAVKEFPQPGLIGLYNTFVGGVDVSYQRTVAYARLMKGAVWYYKMCFLHVRGVYQMHTFSKRNPPIIPIKEL